MCNLYEDLNIVGDRMRRLGGESHIRKEDESTLPPPPPPKKRFLMGNFIIKDQWENQEQDGRTPSGGTHHRS